ncbi:hypothetical protein L6R52_22465 [Myxococcota bacterium]|nr:hypothetical protein [Myxococcota bacterium]
MPPPAFVVRLNGTLLNGAARDGRGSALDVPLRGIALSDSPVLIHSDVDAERTEMVMRLHVLGRRRRHPIHVCHTEQDAEALFRLVPRDEQKTSPASTLDAVVRAAGTWAMQDVGTWSKEHQLELVRLLAILDEHRLHGRLPHDKIPRVMVVQSSRGPELVPELQQRLSFFELSLGEAAAERPTSAD